MLPALTGHENLFLDNELTHNVAKHNPSLFSLSFCLRFISNIENK